MENRLLNKYGAYGTTDIGQEVACIAEECESRLKHTIQLHNLSVAELHTLQHIVHSAIDSMVAEVTLLQGLKIRKEERQLAFRNGDF